MRKPQAPVRGLEIVVDGIAKLLTVVVLAPLFLGGFTLFRLMFRRGIRDRLERWIEPDASSYWRQRNDESPSDSEPSLQRYERQI